MFLMIPLFLASLLSHNDNSSIKMLDQTPSVSAVCQAPKNDDSIATKRAKYVCEIEKYLPHVQAALAEAGETELEQAKTLNQLRRSIGKKYKDLTPKWLLSAIYCRNQKVYQDPLGPQYKSLLASGKNNTEIIKSSMRTGGKDLFVNNAVVMAILNTIDRVGLGPHVEPIFSYWSGESCPVIAD